MPDRSAPIVVTPRACPFVALDGDRDRRLDTPDPLHRCFAEPIPRARSVGHQAEFCLSPAFGACPIFQDWASRAAAEPVAPRVPPDASVGPPAVPRVAREMTTTPGQSGTAAIAGAQRADDPGTGTGTGTGTAFRASRAREVQAADEALIATRPVPSYRAGMPTAGAAHPTGATSSSAPTSATGSTSSSAPAPPTGATSPVRATMIDGASLMEPDGAMGMAGADPLVPDDIPVIRSLPPAPGKPVPPPEDDWTAPPPWLRPPTGPVWVAEAVPPPDALADIGTQPVRRARPAEPSPAVLAEAAIPVGVDPLLGVTGSFEEETTGMPPELRAALAAPLDPPRAQTHGGAQASVAEAPGADARQTDPSVSAELAASRYRTDAMAGLVVDEEAATGSDGKAAARSRRVPIDVQASASLGSQAQARPSARSTGSREWEGPRRFEAYAATQRRRPPTPLLVGGGVVALVVLLLGVFLLPGMLMGGGPAATATPAPTTLTAAVTATDVPSEPTTRPERTARPEKTPKPRTYTVRSGDTLIKIAKRFKVSVAKLTCLNRIKNPNNVMVGRTLTIPPKGYRCSRDD